MIYPEAIRPQMPVVGSEGRRFATVDHIEGRDRIKLTKDESGRHHYIPMSWVLAVDEEVHVDRPGRLAMREWSTSPMQAGRDGSDPSDEDPLHAERVRSQQG